MNKAELYAKTLHDYFAHHTESESDSFLEKFITYLESKDEKVILSDVIREVSKLDKRAEAGQLTKLVVRDEADAEKYKALVQEAHAGIFNFDALETIIDENIVGGYQIISETQMIDNSYKQKLIEMYNQLIS